MLKRLRYGLTVIVSVAFVVGCGILLDLFPTFRAQLGDRLQLPQSPRSDIVIVAIDEASIQTIGQWPWPRSTFASLVRALDQARVIGLDVNFKEPSRYGTADDRSLTDVLRQSKAPVVITRDHESAPLPALVPVASNGFANLITDHDGGIRSLQYGTTIAPSFALQIATQGKYLVPLVPTGVSRIVYGGGAHSYPHLAVRDVLSGAIPADTFANKIVLVGATARDLQDYHGTPFGLISGVEIQASVLATLLNQKFAVAYPKTDIALAGAIILITVVIGLSTIGVVRKLIALAALVVLLNASIFLLHDRGYVLDLLWPNLAFVLSAIGSLTAQYRLVAAERRFIRDTFSRYLAPQVIEQLIKYPELLKLGGTKVELTILFSDIRGFTSLSEKMPPEQLITFLNHYLTRMTGLVLDHRGIIDKYIGDAVMAFWGAPLQDPLHAFHGVQTARAMIDSLAEFNAQSREHGEPEIDIGIGLNSGTVTVGNMGSEKRFDYTVLGDSVNLASRLESLTKTYGVNIIISQATLDLCQGEPAMRDVLVREIDRVQVKGKKQGVTIHQVVANAHAASVAAINDLFSTAREHYYAGRWPETIATCETILTQLPTDGPTKVFLERAREFVVTPPEQWQGVFEMTHK